MKVICDSFGSISISEIEVVHSMQIKSKKGDFKIVETPEGLKIYAESHPGNRIIVKPVASNCIVIETEQ